MKWMKSPWHNLLNPPPAPPGFGEGTELPEQDASWLSRLTLHWLGAFLDVGFSRPLEKEDLWELPPTRHAGTLADTLEKSYYSRCPPKKRPFFMRDNASRSVQAEAEKASNEKQEGATQAEDGLTTDPIYDESLFTALYQSFKPRILSSGLLLVVSDTLRTTLPLVNKVFLTWLTDSYVYARLTDDERALAASEGFSKPRGVGYGIGLAIAIYVMQESASVMANHFMLIGMTSGLYARSSVIGLVFHKSLRLSGRSRAEHSVGKITTLISSDTTRVDTIAYLGHYLWEAPIQIAIAIGLLVGTIGYSALAGLAVLFAGIPVQFVLVTIMIKQRQKCGIRLIKSYGWEHFYTQRITGLREQEVGRIKKSSVAAALLIATFYFLPVFASILAFITYSLTNHQLSVATIFTALQLFNVMRAPLLLFPLVLSGLADAMVSFGRLTKFLTAEELAETYLVDKSQVPALYLDGDFEWETVLKLEDTPEQPLSQAQEIENLRKEAARKKAEKTRLKEAKKTKITKLDEKADNGHDILPSHTGDFRADIQESPGDKPFALKNIHVEIQEGAFVAIVGPVGSGKSSILQAMIGEMRCSRGKVVFNDHLAYVPQSPWIKNETVEENILFGQKYDDKRFQEIIQACSLEHDLNIFTHGQHTEIGEKGINLSGGQKARVSLARAAYSESKIVLLDDPFAAVDVHVGTRILEDCILQGPLAHRTRILVTHALHILDKTDYIYVIEDGKIVEEGSYHNLISKGAVLSRLIDEHGKIGTQKQRNAHLPDEVNNKQRQSSVVASALIQEEERNVGAVTWDVYKKYFQNAGGLFWAPVIAILLLVVEGNNTFTTLFLGFWSGNMLHKLSQGDYMAVYGALGAALSISTFVLTYAFVIIGLSASLNLYRTALAGVLNSRITFFDTTPIGRIQSRLSKDQDTIDSVLPQTMMHVLTTFFSVIGTVGLVFYAFPYLGIIFLPLGILYYGASVYYRRSSVETKRLDSLNRSMLYASYTETLTGLSSIRAYGVQKRAILDAEHGLDMENRAYLMTIIMQRWLALRLEFFADFLVLGIGFFAAGLRTHVNPSKTGVVLSYTLAATAIFSEMISLFASSEQNMNAVERVLHYVELPSEGSESEPAMEPSSNWPAAGEISFRDVKLKYREGLPLVLKGISFDIKAGEKIGIVGRTGSGKSSIIQALLRLVEIQDGHIAIDNLDISTVGFNTLRTRLAFVPQDTTLFLGTLRDNLDPGKLRTDAELISILQQAWLLPKEGLVDPAVEAKFSLESSVGDEGSNYSAGEKQLLALCRALVKKSRIIILDEATSSVDVETDFKVQKTIQSEFSDSTLICIAHRLNTIVHYDRILVMDDGKVAEFDSALCLFDRSDSLFRALCDEAHLTRSDITEHHADEGTSK